MYKKSKLLITMSLILGAYIGMYGQEYIGQKEGSFLKVLGTSTLHDWEEIAEDYTTSLSLDSSKEIKKIEVNVKVESLESGKSAMNKITYNALKSEKHPTILFSFINQENEIKISEGTSKIDVKGFLTIAGVKKEINLTLECTQNQSGVILKGSKLIKMTDFGIKPPKAMFGTIKTGNEITIEFNTIYKLK